MSVFSIFGRYYYLHHLQKHLGKRSLCELKIMNFSYCHGGQMLIAYLKYKCITWLLTIFIPNLIFFLYTFSYENQILPDFLTPTPEPVYVVDSSAIIWDWRLKSPLLIADNDNACEVPPIPVVPIIGWCCLLPGELYPVLDRSEEVLRL